MARKFNIIKKKNLPDEAKIVGFSFLKEPTDKDKKNKKYDFYEYSNENEIGCQLPKRKAYLSHTKGYVEVDNKIDTFVEVKSRTDTGRPSKYGRPSSAVDYKKRQNLRLCAEDYLRKNKPDKKPRIDVIEVYLREISGEYVLSDKGIKHIENVFC